MRVLYLNPFSQEVSGPDESLRALLAPLVASGIEAHVVLPAPGPQVVRYEQVGAAVHFVPFAILRRSLTARTALYPVQLARSALAVARLARRVGADLIHTNMEVLLEGGVASRLLGLPHVLHYRGNTLDRPKLVFDALTRVWTSTADHVYCISHATAGVFERRGRSANVEVLYNPVDTRAFAAAERSAAVRASLGAGPEQRLVGTVGRIHPRKDLETFVRACARVASRFDDARFVIVGVAELAGESEYQQRVEALAVELGIRDKLAFAGARRDVPAVMKALDTFVLTSRHEGFGRVVAEAMAAACPAVVTDEGAPPELVTPDDCGLLGRPQDPDDFARSIARILSGEVDGAAMGARAARRAQAFDTHHAAARVRARYETLCAPADRAANAPIPNQRKN
jgi:glycosyltransferase involved in cell wall biosynthesis